MPPPNEAEKNRRPYWLLPPLPGTTKARVVYTSPSAGGAGIDIPGVAGRLGGIGEHLGASDPTPPDGAEVTYTSGEVWDFPADDSEPVPLNATAIQASKIRTAQEYKDPSIVTGPDKNKYVLNPDTGEYELVAGIPTQPQGKYITDSSGNVVWMPNPTPLSGEFGPEGGTPTEPGPRIMYRDPNAELVRREAEARLAETQRRTAQIGAPPQRAPRYADEVTRAQLENQRLERELQDPYTQALQAQEAALNHIHQQLLSGEIDQAQANRLMSLTRSNLDAVLQGTTPWGMQQEQQRRRESQQNLAGGFLENQARTGTGLAEGLLSGLGSIYGKVYSSTKPPAIDPLQLAQGFMGQMGGGQDLSDMARAVLSGAFKPQGGG